MTRFHKVADIAVTSNEYWLMVVTALEECGFSIVNDPSDKTGFHFTVVETLDDKAMRHNK